MIIKKITKEKNNYQVVFEKETLVLKAAIIVRFGLHQGMEISHSLKREIIKANEKEIDALTEIRDTILPKLMSGEIRVPLDNEE